MGNKIGVLVAQGLVVPIFFKDVPNFISSKVCSKVGNDLQSLPKGFQMNKWTIRSEIGVSLTQGLDVSKFLKDVQNFLNDVP